MVAVQNQSFQDGFAGGLRATPHAIDTINPLRLIGFVSLTDKFIDSIPVL